MASGKDWQNPYELTQNHLDFIEFLVNPDSKQTQADWARDRGLGPNTVAGWKKVPTFKRALEARMNELNISPDRVAAVVDAMYKKANTGDSRAADLFLKYVDKLNLIRQDDRKSGELSDEELLVALAEATQSVKDRMKSRTPFNADN